MVAGASSITLHSRQGKVEWQRVKDKGDKCQLSTFLEAHLMSHLALTFMSHWPELGFMATSSCIGVLLGKE